MYNDLEGIVIGGFGRPDIEHGPLTNLKLAQILHQILTPVNVSTKSSSLMFSTSGLYNDLEGIGIGGFERPDIEHGPLTNLKLAQILHQILTPVNVSTKSSSLTFSTSGEYVYIFSKPWIITSETVPTKTVPTKQYQHYNNSHMI